MPLTPTMLSIKTKDLAPPQYARHITPLPNLSGKQHYASVDRGGGGAPYTHELLGQIRDERIPNEQEFRMMGDSAGYHNQH